MEIQVSPTSDSVDHGLKLFLRFPANSKFDEARRKREEKKMQRQREMEARRAARAGPMKLGMGAKKL